MEIETKKIFPALRSDNGRHPWITGALYLDGRIFLSDHNNPRMLVYDEDGVLLTQLLLPGNPRDLTRFGNDVIVLTLPGEMMLQIVDLEKMKIRERVHVGYECLGITCKNEKLYLACGKHLTLVNIEGQILDTMRIREGNAVYLCCDDNEKIYYTGFKSDVLYCMNMSGIIVFKYSCLDLKFCRGVTLDPEGNAIVAGRWSHNILVISPEGLLKTELMNANDGIDYPLHVIFRNGNPSKFLVLNNNGKNVMICEIQQEDQVDHSDVVDKASHETNEADAPDSGQTEVDEGKEE